ncbi:MAG TPA: hypothetical protein VHY22_18385 [Chthoniobacteraceae bacterium]|jgi:hypothetical protein|nr:hypothetical protein [Chthoniobacteraceae bacterium]
MNGGEKKIWFPAKRYGWGWGPPACWQGWVVMAVWVAVLITGEFYFKPNRPEIFAFVCVMVVILIGICYWKGEKPRWRWGGK